MQTIYQVRFVQKGGKSAMFFNDNGVVRQYADPLKARDDAVAFCKASPDFPWQFEVLACLGEPTH